MAKYLAIAKTLLSEFRATQLEQMERDLNSPADTLAGLASVLEGGTGQNIAVDLISAPSHKVYHEIVLVNTELGLS